RSARREKGMVGKIAVGARERGIGGGRKRLYADPAIAFVPEGGRTSGGVNAGAILRLDDDDLPVRRERGREARVRDPGADNENVGGMGRRVAHAKAHIGPRGECKPGGDFNMVTLW